MLMAEGNGGKVGAVMTHWYLGTSDNSILTITQPLQLAQQVATLAPIDLVPWPGLITVTQEVASGTAVSLPVTLQLLDGGITSGSTLVRTPLPGVPIAVEIVINNPAEAAAISAEEALASAQVAYDVFVAANPGVCDLIADPADPEAVVERDPEKCAKQKELALAVANAQTAPATAQGRAAGGGTNLSPQYGSGNTAALLPGPGQSYDMQLATAQSMIADNPQRAAQVVKQWVTENE